MVLTFHTPPCHGQDWGVFLPLQGDRTPKPLKWTETCPEHPPTATTWTELIPLGTGGQGDRVKGAGMALVPAGTPHLRLPLLVHPVDLAPHEHSDPAFAPSLLAAEEVGDEEGEAWQGGSQ